MKYDLVGVDDNAFAVMGYVTKALKREGMRGLVGEYQKKAMSKDYVHLLMVSLDYLKMANTSAEYGDERY